MAAVFCIVQYFFSTMCSLKPLHVCGMIHPYVWHDSFTCAHWRLIHMRHNVLNEVTCAAYCIWSFIYSISNLNRWFTHLGFFCHVPLKRDQWDWDWKFRLNDIANAICCTHWSLIHLSHNVLNEFTCAHFSWIRVTWLVQTCDVTHLYVWYDPFIRV